MLLIHMNTLHIYGDNNLPSLLAGLKTQPFSPSLLGYDKNTFLRCCHQGSLSLITWCCALPFILHSPKGMNQWLLFEYITLCVPSSACRPLSLCVTHQGQPAPLWWVKSLSQTQLSFHCCPHLWLCDEWRVLVRHRYHSTAVHTWDSVMSVGLDMKSLSETRRWAECAPSVRLDGGDG